MTLQEQRTFGTPNELYDRPILEALLEGSGIKTGQSYYGLAHVAITGALVGNVWQVYAVDPENPPTTLEETLGAFTEDGEGVNQGDILRIADTWLRESDSVEWVPGGVISVNNLSLPHKAIGHVLVRATEAPSN